MLDPITSHCDLSWVEESRIPSYITLIIYTRRNRLNDRGTQWAGGRVEEVIDTEKKLGQFKKTQTSSALVFAL